MKVTFQEHFEEQHGWSWISKERCPICGEYFLTITDADPGSREQAVVVAHICKNCSPEHGDVLFGFEDHHFRSDPNHEFEQKQLDYGESEYYKPTCSTCGDGGCPYCEPHRFL